MSALPQVSHDGSPSRGTVRMSLAVGLLCALIGLGAQAALVYRVYGGDWNGLFLTGAGTDLPPALTHVERVHVFENSRGYDAQYYHLIAHDPFRLRGFDAFVDVPALRYQRLLVPAAAWLLAGGSDRYIDAAYIAVILLCALLGGYWTSRYAVAHGRHPAWGLIFLLTPSVIVSLERLTVEASLAALTAGFLLYSMRRPSWKLYAVLTASVFARETGLFLLAGYGLWCLRERAWVRAVTASLTALPGMIWIQWNSMLSSRAYKPIADAVGVRTRSGGFRILGIWRRLVNPISYRSVTAGQRIVLWASDASAIVGMITCSLLGIRMAIRKEAGPGGLTAAVAGVVALVLVSSRGQWNHPVSYTRPFTALFVILLMHAAATRRLWLAIPILMINLRLAVEYCPRLLVILGLAPA